MQSKRILNLSASIFILLLIVVSCANPVAPTGGIKDEIPPVFLGSNPVNKARNFKSDKIDLTFDEFVVLKDLNTQLLVSPLVKTKLDVKTKGKGVRILFAKDEVLAENTTYTIYFGDAIVDLHENNPLPNFQYVFATGQDIDSLSIRGRVLGAQYLLPSEGVFVCLYLDNNDTLAWDEMPLKVRPYYVSKTNAEGYFEINNIRNDRYLIFAVMDANSNYFKDMPNEFIAFSDSLIFPEEVFDFIPDTIPIDTSNVVLMDSLWANYAVRVTKETHTLLLFEPQDSVQKVMKKELLDNNRMHFEFKYPQIKPIEVEILNADTLSEAPIFIEEYSPNKDSLDLWFLKPFADTLQLRMVVDTLKADTILVLLNAPPKKEAVTAKRGKPAKEKTKVKAPAISYTSNLQANFPFFSKGSIVFKTPIKSANFENCTLIEDTLSVPFKIEFTDSVKRKLVIDYPWKEGKDYRFEIPDQALTDIYDIKNDSIVAKFKTTEASVYGKLILEISLPEVSNSSWLVMLIKGTEDKEQILRMKSIQENGKVEFANLAAEKYRIKILEDRDNNGRWSSGNYVEKLLPEKVFYFPETIEIKVGWNVEEVWNVNYKVQENSSPKPKK